MAETAASGRRPLRCLLRLHSYVVTVTDTGERYLVCRRCGREDFVEPPDLHGVDTML